MGMRALLCRARVEKHTAADVRRVARAHRNQAQLRRSLGLSLAGVLPDLGLMLAPRLLAGPVHAGRCATARPRKGLVHARLQSARTALHRFALT